MYAGETDALEMEKAGHAGVRAQFGATLDNVVEENVYVLDEDSAFAAAGKVRIAAYGTDWPQCASNLIGVSRLAMPV